jgi:PGF-pre-PGF domain-containing protein
MSLSTKTINVFLLIFLVLVSCPAVYGLGLGTFERKFVYVPDQVSSITYYITKNEGASVSFVLEYNGSLAPYQNFSYDYTPYSWYSNKGNLVNFTLERGFDLSNVSSAKLTFFTDYGIEYGWDFGFIEVSTNNGSSWSQLAGTTTTTYRDPGAVVGIPGAPAYTGAVSGFTFETVNLTPYTGNLVKLRFRYETDPFVQEKGWLIDEISIPEIGFFDGVDSGTNGWVSYGWNRTNTGYDTIENIPLRLDFDIPSNFTYNNTVERITLTQKAVSEGTGVTGGVSLVKITTFMPPVERYVPPPVQPGGGNGGGGPSRYFIYTREGAIYYTSLILSSSPERIVLDVMKNSVLSEVIIKVSTQQRNVRFVMTPFSGVPPGIYTPIEGAYNYFSIGVSNLNQDVIEYVKILFWVTDEWLEKSNLTVDDVALFRYSTGQWQKLATNYVRADGQRRVFEARSPGFSVFAIGKSGDLPRPPVLSPGPTEKYVIDIASLPIVYRNDSQFEEFRKLLEKKVIAPRSEGGSSKKSDGATVEESKGSEGVFDKIRAFFREKRVPVVSTGASNTDAEGVVNPVDENGAATSPRLSAGLRIVAVLALAVVLFFVAMRIRTWRKGNSENMRKKSKKRSA